MPTALWTTGAFRVPPGSFRAPARGSSAPLVRPQRNHRIEPRGAQRRVNPEEQSHCRTHYHAHHRHRGSYGRGKGRISPQHQRHQKPQRNADHSTGDALHEAFRDELLQDIALRGPQGPPHANLSLAQGHTHQHHVHNHDPADQDRNRADQNEHAEKRRADALPQRHVAVLRANEEVILHFWAEVPPRPQDELRLVLYRFEIPRARLYVDGQAGGMESLDFQKQRQRNDHEVVLVLSEHAANLFDDADHRELIVPDAYGLPDGVHPEKQPLYDRISNQADARAVICLPAGKEAAVAHLPRIDTGHVGGLAVEVHVGRFFILVSRSYRSAGRGAHLVASRASFLDCPHVIHINLFVLERLDDDVEVRDREWRARDLEHVGSQVRDFVLHIQVRSLDDGHHRDERRHPHRQPQHGQRRPQLVRL